MSENQKGTAEKGTAEKGTAEKGTADKAAAVKKTVVQQSEAPQSTNLRDFELHQIKLTTNKGKFTGAKIIDTLRTVKIDPVDAERLNQHVRGALEFYAPAGEYKLADTIDMATIRKMSPGANWGEPTEEESE